MSFSLKWKPSPQESMNIDKRSASYPSSEGADMRSHFVKPSYRSKSFAVSSLERTVKVKERSVSFMLPPREKIEKGKERPISFMPSHIERKDSGKERPVSFAAPNKEIYYPYSFIKSSQKFNEPCLGEFDLDIYSDSEISRTNNETSCEIVSDQMANIKCMFQYLPSESSVLVELRNLSTHFRPITFQGVKIIQSYEVILEMKHLSSIKKIFAATHNIERKNSKDIFELKIGNPIKISLKNKNLEKLVMSLILYESSKRHRLLACGYVRVKVKDITSTPEVLEIQEPFHPSSKIGFKFRELSPLLTGRGASLNIKEKLHNIYIQSVMMYGSESWTMKVDGVKRLKRSDDLGKSLGIASKQLSPKGTISGSIEWNSNSNQLNIKVLSASTVKYNRKEYFVKATLFIGNVEMASLKTESAISLCNEIRILEKLSFSVPFNEKRSEIYRTSLLLQMYEKNRITNELFGKTILGPNMDTECRKSIYCWHKILCTPNKEIQFRSLPLYL